MYLLFELVIFSPLIIYACNQVRKLVPGSGLKHIFVGLFVLLFLGYPLAEILSHREIGPWARYTVLSGYYCLPYLLYITLSVVAIDLVILLARAVRLLKSDAVYRPKFRFLRLASYLLIPAVVVIWGAWNNNRLQVKSMSIELPRKSSSIERLHVVFASDFHLSQITNDRLVENFVNKVNALKPDIVLIGGDILEGDRQEKLEKFENQFRNIRAIYGVYAASGNHERHRLGADRFFMRSGMRLVEDRIEKLGGSFYLGLRKSARLSERKSITELLKGAPDNLPIILVDHSPTDLENVSKTRVDLQVSGHTHNGQLFPVNLLVMPFQYELPWGTKVKRHTVFAVSSGIQAWGPPVRTAGMAEILSIEISFHDRAHNQNMHSVVQWAMSLKSMVIPHLILF
jgi:uncharacterized protein